MGWPHHRHHGRRGHGHGHAGLLTAVDRVAAAVITILQAADHHQVVGAHGVTRDNWLRAAGRTSSDAGDAAGGRGPPGRHAAVTRGSTPGVVSWAAVRAIVAATRHLTAAQRARVPTPAVEHAPHTDDPAHRTPAYTGGPPVRPHAGAERAGSETARTAYQLGRIMRVRVSGGHARQACRSATRFEVGGRQLEAVERERGRDRAADEGPVTGRLRCLPPAGRHPQLGCSPAARSTPSTASSGAVEASGARQSVRGAPAWKCCSSSASTRCQCDRSRSRRRK